MNYSTSDICAISLRIFGSEDYESMLMILPPYDGMVKLFKKEVDRLQQGGNNT